jgi:hypothetical protein
VRRHIDRMPNEYYLIGNEKAADKDLKQSAILDNDYDAELDDYFDFVLVEKDEMPMPSKTQAKNREEKIHKEMQVMADASSQLIAVNGANNQADAQQQVKLEDFKIKKMIDKGSFGKVFHVVNMKDGQEYAMKRINKDILIEKG